MNTKTGIAEVNETELYYEVSGSGKSLVLINGFGTDTRMWDDQFEVFSKEYQVVRYDNRGFGKSAVPTKDPYSHATDLKCLLEYLGISNTHVVGLSKGGHIAAEFVLRYPDLVNKLVLADSMVAPILDMHLWEEEVQKNGLTNFLKNLAEGDVLKSAQAHPKVFSLLSQMLLSYSGWHFFNDDPVEQIISDKAPAPEILKNIKSPTLILIGELENTTRRGNKIIEVANILEANIPNSKKVILPGVGHMSNMENPENFNKEVLNFINGY